MKRPRDWNLRSKIILHVVVIGLLMVVLLFYFCTQTQKGIIQTMSRQKAELVAGVVEKSLLDSMSTGRSLEVHFALQNIGTSENIRGIRILNLEGRVLNSIDQAEVGMIDSSISREALKSSASGMHVSHFSETDRGATVVGYKAIENRKECHSCHSQEAAINGILEVKLDYSEIRSILVSNRLRQSLISLTALAILTFVILRLFEKVINRPLSSLKREMKKVQGGNLNISLPRMKNDEIGSLAASFETMVLKLEQANHQILELFEKQMEKAEHLASLGELAAGLAHEIKNPIAGMKGALEIFSKKAEENDPQKEIFHEMLLQIDKIDKVIRDLLRYAKPKEMKLIRLNPNECIRNAVNLARPHIQNKNIRLDFEGAPKDIKICLDPDKIQDVMLNLLLNSIAAIPESGTIGIRISEMNEKDLEIEVRDDGKGIKAVHMSQLFTPFFTTKSRGTGLGLAICQRIVESHGGSIYVHSVEGRGTSFYVRLPLHGECDET